MQHFITKRGSSFYYKTRQIFIIKRGSFFITKRAVFITKRGRYYKMRRFYYKTRQVLQNEPIITKRGTTRVIQIQIVKRYADSHWADCRRFLASKHICLVMEIATGQNALADGLFYNKN